MKTGTTTMLLFQSRLTQSLSFYMRQRCCRQISSFTVKSQDVENASVEYVEWQSMYSCFLFFSLVALLLSVCDMQGGSEQGSKE